MANHKHELDEQLLLIKNTIEPILDKEEKTAEEIEVLNKIEPVMKSVLQSIKDMKMILQESMVRQSTIIYEQIKKLAAEGNEQAIIAYKHMKKSYEAMLEANMNSN